MILSYFLVSSNFRLGSSVRRLQCGGSSARVVPTMTSMRIEVPQVLGQAFRPSTALPKHPSSLEGTPRNQPMSTRATRAVFVTLTLGRGRQKISANFERLVSGCIEANFCDSVFVGIMVLFEVEKFSTRSTRLTSFFTVFVHAFLFSDFLSSEPNQLTAVFK